MLNKSHKSRFLEADFEEVGPRNVPEDFDELDKLGVINVCGVDRDGRPIIIVAMAENKIVKKNQKFFAFFENLSIF